MIRLLRTEQEAQAAAITAGIIAQELRSKPTLVLGLATGRTMERVYAHLVDLHRQTGLDFSHCHTFNLDEYLGIPASHPGSYRRYMNERLFSQVNIPLAQTHVPDGMAADLGEECSRYEILIEAAGGLDLQLLGLGLTGHIGFNEPPSAFTCRTHAVDLAELTRQQNRELFAGDASAVPASALTMGLGTIMEASRCLLLATGASKAAILAQAFLGPVTPELPASVLQRHPHCQVVADESACADWDNWNRAEQAPNADSIGA